MARPDASLASFGGGEQTNQDLDAAAQTADQSSKIFQERAERGRQMAVDQETYGAALQLSQLQTSLINKAKAQQGENSFGIYDPTMSEFKDQTAEIAKGLQTPEARLSFARLAAGHQAELDRVLQDHIFTQRQEVTKGTIAAASEQFENNAIQASLLDQKSVKDNLGYARASDAALARTAGLSDISAKTFLDQRQSARQLKVLNSFTSAGQDLTAAQYFKDNADDFKGEDRVKAQAMVMEGSAHAQALRAVDKIFSPSYGTMPEDQGQGPTITPGAQTLSEAESKVRDIQDPKVRGYASQEVARRWQQMQEDKTQTQTANFQSLAKVAAKTGDINQVMAFNPDVFMNGITPAQRTELFAQAKMFAEHRDPVTDATTWYTLHSEGTDPKTAGAFMQRDLTLVRSKISEKHFDELATLQGDLKTKSGAAAPTLAFSQIVEDELLKNNVFPPVSKMDSDQQKQYAAFRLEAADRFDTFKRVDLKGVGNPTQAQMQDIVGQMIRNKATSGGILWNSTLPSAAVLPKDRVLSKDAEADMSALILGRGKKITDDKLQRMNEAFQNGNRKLYLKIADE